ncbi:hypothetical protein EDD90_7874 [Streptomyces sp. Ag109_O5-1]|uniref:hypothetical protein n=1 Tax=Streptomyces sp. Ag109_O5-1 TaxID=1938851 RepID=UPI000F4F2D0B|nr:hypothetical protein [Streptomyces sp. Ag109_O5-1]RPE44623.1 hypothetical protein EDD90_7874 [Streptomyces sp. Ag109_O5-1]
MEGEAAYGFIVNVDAQGSGLLSDTEKPEMRRRLYDVTGTAFEQAGIRPPRLYQEDRGDGILGVLAPDVPPVRVVGEWVENLHQNLRETNRDLRKPLRLRVGLHIGRVTADAFGRSGRAVDLACRLCDCGTAKAILRAAADAPLVVAASDRVHEDFVLPGGRWVDPKYYRRYDVDLKEGRTTAWFMVPGRCEPPEPYAEQHPEPAADGPGGLPEQSGPRTDHPPQPPAAADTAGTADDAATAGTADDAATADDAPTAPTAGTAAAGDDVATGDRVVQNVNQYGTGRIVVAGTVDSIDLSDGGGR